MILGILLASSLFSFPALSQTAMSGLPQLCPTAPAPVSSEPNPSPSPSPQIVAGTLASQLNVTLTGTSDDPDFIVQQVRQALTHSMTLQSGAEAVVGDIPAPQALLLLNGSLVLNVPIAACGNGRYADVSGIIQVTVKNVAASNFDPEFLYYSDDPEYITGDGVYFRGQVEQGHPVRLYDYHAEHAHQDPHRLLLILQNKGNQATAVHIMDILGGANPDVFVVGSKTTERTLISKSQNKGLILNLAPGETYLYRDITLKSDDLVIQNMDFDVLSGGPLNFSILALSLGVDFHSVDLNQAIVAGDGHNRHGRFNIRDYGDRTVTYAVGTESSRVMIGIRQVMPPSTNLNDPGKDFGDYGVPYNVTFNLSNPTQMDQTVYVYESAGSGPFFGIYFVDGNMDSPVEMPCVTSTRPMNSRYSITSFLVPANSNQTHHIDTMASGGSFLPFSLGVTTTPPIAKVPPGLCWPQPAASPSPSPSP